MINILQGIISLHILEWKSLYFDLSFTEVFFQKKPVDSKLV